MNKSKFCYNNGPVCNYIYKRVWEDRLLDKSTFSMDPLFLEYKSRWEKEHKSNKNRKTEALRIFQNERTEVSS